MPKISALGTISQLTTSSILPVVDNNETQKVTLKRIVEFVSASIDVTFATEIELLQSASSITSSLNAFASSSILSVNSKLSTSSFEAYTASVQSVNTSSLLLSSSFNTFTSSYKTDSSSFDSRIDNLELINVTPFLSSSTFNTFTSSYVNHSSSIDSRLDVLEEISITPFLSASTFNSYTSSNESKWSTLGGQTGSYILSSQTSSFITEAETGSFLTSLPNGLISGSGRIVELGFATTSSVLNIDTSSLVTTSSFNTFTSSLSGVYSSSIQLTGSFVRNSLTSSMFVGYSNLVNTQNSSTNGEFSLVFVASGSNGYLQTYTDNLSNILYNPSTNRLRVDYISGSIQATNGVISGSSQLPAGLISGSSQISGLGYATTSSVLNIDTSSLVTTSSFNTYTASISTASLVSRLNQIESVSGSWITESETGSFALTANLPVVTPFLSSSIFNTFSSSVNTTTESLNSFTSSINTTIKTRLSAEGVISGSSQILNGSGIYSSSVQLPAGLVSGSSQVLNSSNVLSSSVEGFTEFSSSVNSRINSAGGGGSTDVSMFLSSSTFNSYSASINTSTSSLNSFSSSIRTYTSSINSYTSSVNTFSSSINTFTASVNSTTASLNGKTGSYATTGSNQFKDNQTITGSLTVTSLTTISSSISANSSSLYLSSGSNLFVQNNGLVEITGSVTLSGSMTIQSGSITMPNRPAFRVIGAGSTNITAVTGLSGSLTTIDYNEGGYYSNTNGRFTAPLAGLYQVYFNGRVGNVNSQMQVIVYKNTNIVQLMWETSTNTGATHFGVSGIFKLAANDTLEAKVAVGTIQFDGNDTWGVTYIG